jgi:hypothetical protein
MRIIPLILITRFVHLPQDNTFINTNYAYANLVPNATRTEKIYKRNKRRTFNRYMNNDVYKCYFCEGAAYSPCRKCRIPSCVRCDNTGFEPCIICDGTGRGGPGALPML